MKWISLVSVIAVTPFLSGCQSYEDGVRAICHTTETCTACAEAPPENRSQVLAEHVLDVVSNGDAKALFESFANISPAQRAENLRVAASDAGLESCPLADRYANASAPD